MNEQYQYPSMPGCSAGVSANQSCRCSSPSPPSGSSGTDEYDNANLNVQRSEYSYSSPYEDWSVLDDTDENTLMALRKKACNFLSPESEEAPQKVLPRRCVCGREPRYVCPSLLRKANDMIDYEPESEFLKRMKQQCEFLQSNHPNIFAAIDEGIVNDVDEVENFIMQSSFNQRVRTPSADRQFQIARDGAVRQKYDSPNLFASYEEPCKTNRNDLTYLVEGLQSSDQNMRQSRSPQKKKSEHISRSKKPQKPRGRRKRKSGSEEAEKDVPEVLFEPTLKRPHENSCERCWRYASPARSPVNKPEQKYDPNFRRGHSCLTFGRGDADQEVSDRHISPCRDLQPITSRERTPSPTPPSSSNEKTPPSVGHKTPSMNFTPRSATPSFSQNTPAPPNFRHGTPHPKQKEFVSIWQKPSMGQATSEPVCQQQFSDMEPSPHSSFQQRISERHPSPHPASQQRISERHPSLYPTSQQRISEMHPSPHPASQQRISERHPSPYPTSQQRISEMHPSPHPASQQRISERQPYPTFQQESPQAASQPVRQQKCRVQFRPGSPSPIRASYYDSSTDYSPERTRVIRSPVFESYPDPSCPLAYPESGLASPKSFLAGSEKLPDIPPTETFSDNYDDLNVARYSTFIKSRERTCEAPDARYSRSPPVQQGVTFDDSNVTEYKSLSREKSFEVPNASYSRSPVQLGVTFDDSNATEYKSLPKEKSYDVSNASYSRSETLDSPVCSPRQPSPSRPSTALGTIPEATDSDSSKDKSGKQGRSSPEKVKSPKTSPRQSPGTSKRPSESKRDNSRQSIGSPKRSTSSKIHTPSKSGSPKQGKPKSPSPKSSPKKTPCQQRKSPKTASPKPKSPEADSKRVASPAEVNTTQPRTPQQRPRSPEPRSPQQRPMSPEPRSPQQRPMSPEPRCPQQRPMSAEPRSPQQRPMSPEPRSPQQRPMSPEPRPQERSPVRTPVQEPVKSPPKEYERPDHVFQKCHCRPELSISPNPDYQPSHLTCCHCKWQEQLKNQQNRQSPKKNLDENPKGYDSVAYRCPHLKKTDEANRSGDSEPFGEAELRLMRDQRKDISYEDLSPIPCPSPRKYFVFYMTKCKENKADDDVEVLVEELTQACPKKTDSRTEDITEKMKKIMECPSDSMALRFQKGVSEPCKVPQNSRILYF